MNYKKIEVNEFNLNNLYNINTPFVAKIVSALNFDEKELNFINDNYLKYIGNPFDFKLMDQATFLVKKCIINQEKILVYADYESDGIYSTIMLTKVLKNFEANYAFYVPNKFVDGKGLNANITRMIIRKGYKLVICLANGLESREHIENLRNHGIDVIVIDNHRCDTFPSASAIINPALSSKETSFETTTAILTYKFIRALVGYYDDYSLSIAGMSLVNSRTFLNKENYHILKRTLYILNNKNYPFLSLLNRNYHFVDIDILKEIDNRLNCYGALSHSNDVNKLPLLLDSEVKDDLVAFSKIVNKKRKEFKNDLNAIYNSLKAEKINDDMYLVDLSLIDEMYYFHILTLSMEKENRFLIGYNKEKNQIYYLRNENFGKKDDILTVESVSSLKFEETLKELKKRFKDQKIDELEYDLICLNVEDLTVAGMKNYQILTPFGLGRKEPLFLLKNILKTSLSKSINGLHLVGKLNENLYLAAYDQADKYEQLKDTFNIIIKPSLNYFNEELSVSCKILGFLEEEN